MRNIVTAIILMLGICSAQAQLIKEKAPIDSKYLAGAVPMVDGKVVFSQEIPVTTRLDADSLYKITARYIARSLNKEDVLKRSGMVNDVKSHHMEVGVVQYLTFKKKAFVLDRTQIIYMLTIDTNKDKLVVKMSDISYYYNEESSPEKFTAEEWITDETALNKKKNDFIYRHGKFRTTTIDLFQQTCSELSKFVSTL